jgi:predicted metal-dependent hydrolase
MDPNSIVKGVIFIILIMCFYMFVETDYINDVKYVKSRIDNKEYLVRNNADAQEAADTLARLREKLTLVVDSMVATYGDDARVKRMKKRFNPYKISESAANSTQTSYSVNKGEKIVFCLRTKDKNQEIHDFNTIMFVALHELAHVMTESIGHTVEFWDNFRFILKHSIKNGFYERQDFKSKPVKYCGTMITDSPLRD